MTTNSGIYKHNWIQLVLSAMPYLPAAIFLLMISGCSTAPVSDRDLPPIPESLLVECQPPQQLPDGRPNTQATMLLQDSKDLWTCHDRHKSLADTIRFRQQLLNNFKE